jgi:hypothetical protein
MGPFLNRTFRKLEKGLFSHLSLTLFQSDNQPLILVRKIVINSRQHCIGLYNVPQTVDIIFFQRIFFALSDIFQFNLESEKLGFPEGLQRIIGHHERERWRCNISKQKPAE